MRGDQGRGCANAGSAARSVVRNQMHQLKMIKVRSVSNSVDMIMMRETRRTQVLTGDIVRHEPVSVSGDNALNVDVGIPVQCGTVDHSPDVVGSSPGWLGQRVGPVDVAAALLPHAWQTVAGVEDGVGVVDVINIIIGVIALHLALLLGSEEEVEAKTQVTQSKDDSDSDSNNKTHIQWFREDSGQGHSDGSGGGVLIVDSVTGVLSQIILSDISQEYGGPGLGEEAVIGVTDNNIVIAVVKLLVLEGPEHITWSRVRFKTTHQRLIVTSF